MQGFLKRNPLLPLLLLSPCFSLFVSLCLYVYVRLFRGLSRERMVLWHKSLFHMRPPHITGAGAHLFSIKAETIPVALCRAMFFHIGQPGIDDCLQHHYVYRRFQALSFNLSVYNIGLGVSYYLSVEKIMELYNIGYNLFYTLWNFW